jgi:hypothetical protein
VPRPLRFHFFVDQATWDGCFSVIRRWQDNGAYPAYCETGGLVIDFIASVPEPERINWRHKAAIDTQLQLSALATFQGEWRH